MKQVAFFILAFVLFVGCSSKKNRESKALQLDTITAESYRKLLSESFDWKSIEIKVSNSEKHEFVKSHFPYILNIGDSTYLNSVHAIDINNDGKTTSFIQDAAR